ncbi:hypothetical protein FACS1894132_10510 [Clostridia bacterium]|nr:hypothetical protein FACS1894132_10510 [Clostridia bacterium]
MSADMDKMLASVYLHTLITDDVDEIRDRIRMVVGDDIATTIEKHHEESVAKKNAKKKNENKLN